MPVADTGLARTIRLIAATIAIIVAVSLPLGYWLVVYSFAAEAIAVDTEAHAELVIQRINANPERWRFEIPRLEAIAATHLLTRDLPEKHYILDERGAVIFQSAQSLSPPVLTRSAPLLDSGTVVGRFVTSRSLVPLLRDTALVALFGLALAFAVYLSLSVLPLRALTRTLVSEARFRLTFELAGSGIAHISLDGHFLSVNRSLCAILGYSDKDLVGRTVKELSHPEDRDKTDAARARVHSGELESTRFQKRYLRKDGATVWVDLTVALVRDAQGKPLYEIAVFDDITERKQAEQALRDSAEKLRLFADNVPAMTVSYDENQRCRFANKRYADFFGFSPADIVGRHLREVVGEKAYRGIEGYFAQVLQGNPVTYQITRKLANGESRYLEIKLLPHSGDQGKVLGWFSVITDITEHKLAEERIRRVAHHDSLTGLPNRLLFNDRLNQAVSLAKRDSRQFALLYLDLDKFKPVNDTLGHAAGDELLQGVAARIRQQVRESDTVARVGGDEFAVILPDIAKREEAETVARKIIAALAAPFQLGSRKQSTDIGTSIGIAVYPTDGRDADALVTAADAAMYGAKQVGSSFRFFEA